MATRLMPPLREAAGKSALALIVGIPLFTGLLALYLGQDANFDLRQYHWHNAYAYLNGRHVIDFMPSAGGFFLNPWIDIPFYIIATKISLQAAFLLLGIVQGLNFTLLFLLSYACLSIKDVEKKTAASTGLAALGLFSAVGISQIGTTFYDNVTSLGIFLSLLLLVRRMDDLLSLPSGRAAQLALLFGIPAGLAMGLKLTCAGFCLGIAVGLLALTPDARRCLLLSFSYSMGALLALLAAYGHWGLYLYHEYGSPIFPLYNQIFRSPLLPFVNLLDYATLKDARLFFFPFFFGADSGLVSEVPWRDFRLPLLYALLIFLCAQYLFTIRRRGGARSGFRCQRGFYSCSRARLIISGF